MERSRNEVCGQCLRSDVAARLYYLYELPGRPESKARAEGAVKIEVFLCSACAEKFHKHLKRFLGKKHLRPTTESVL
jgi:predicted RNase H-like nuclease